MQDANNSDVENKPAEEAAESASVEQPISEIEPALEEEAEVQIDPPVSEDEPAADVDDMSSIETDTPEPVLEGAGSPEPVPVEAAEETEEQETSNLSRRSYFIAFSLILVIILAVVAYLQFANGSFPGFGSSQGFQTTASGLQYMDNVVGTGEEVATGSSVSVHYVLTLEDGTEVDSSVARGTPFTFTVGQGQVIPGWEEGLVGMRVGGNRTLVIPPELAYGEQGAGGGIIPPNATLRFEVELLAIHEVGIEKLADGEGPPVSSGDRVTLEYTGSLEDGTEFDSSAVSGPIVFTVDAGEIIPGLNQGVDGMQVGEKRRLTIPPELAFGNQAVGTIIPPNATLVIEIELTGIE